MTRKVSNEILERQPPCNIEAELGVLGSIMLLPEVCDDVDRILRAADFHDDANRRLYNALVAMHEAGEPIDGITVSAHLKRNGTFEQIGGALLPGGIKSCASVFVLYRSFRDGHLHRSYYSDFLYRRDNGCRRRFDAGCWLRCRYRDQRHRNDRYKHD